MAHRLDAKTLLEIALAGIAAAGAIEGVAGCGRCVNELVIRAPVESPVSSCSPADCPAKLGGATFSTCSPVPETALVECAYTAGYADPAEDLDALPDDACRSQCADAPDDRFLGCVAVEGGAACVLQGGCVGGRGHAGVPGLESKATALGDALSEMAHMEAIAVAAFGALAHELEAIEAPPELVRRCRVAAQDEARHVELVSAVARAHGYAGAVDTPNALPMQRDREALAIENAVEGCVRETYGVVGAAWLARLVPAQFRDALDSVAEDEATHAALAWDLDAWLISGLSQGARARVSAARSAAFAELETRTHVPALTCFGVPPTAQRVAARTLARELGTFSA